jgi:GNAT superfamily N-acetyltransferase
VAAADWPYSDVERLGGGHNRDAFSCGRSELDHYLREQARQDERKRAAVTYVVTEHGAAAVAGFYTLSSYTVVAGALPPEVTAKLARYDPLPATLIGRLAVDQNHQGRGLGAFLLTDAAKRSYAESERVGSCLLVVEAKDEQAADFYRHFGFIGFPDRPGRLFLTMRTIAQLP